MGETRLSLDASEFPLARIHKSAVPPAANVRAAVRQVKAARNALGDERVDSLHQAPACFVRRMLDLNQLRLLRRDERIKTRFAGSAVA